MNHVTKFAALNILVFTAHSYGMLAGGDIASFGSVSQRTVDHSDRCNPRLTIDASNPSVFPPTDTKEHKSCDKLALLRSTPLDNIKVINLPDDYELTDGNKQFLVLQLMAAEDAVTVDTENQSMLIIDASKTYALSDVSEEEDDEDIVSCPLATPVARLDRLLQAEPEEIELVSNGKLYLDSPKNKTLVRNSALAFFNNLLNTVVETEDGRLAVDVGSLTLLLRSCQAEALTGSTPSAQPSPRRKRIQELLFNKVTLVGATAILTWIAAKNFGASGE
ncbi:MAG: hypothetical protein AB7F19_02715 [Candidatus Babeliales bacterium]